MKNWSLWLLPALCVTGAPAEPSPVVKKYCLACHNAGLKSGGVGQDKASPREAPEVWEKAVRRLRTRFMPPPGAPRPDEATYKALTAELETALDGLPVKPGRTDTFRRLNRTEYQNAIRDLLALDVDVTALLPADDASHGFDNVTLGALSPALLERYLGAARKISRLALGLPARSVGGDTVQLPPDLTQEEHFEDLPLGTRGGTSVRYTFPADAEYDVQIRLARDRNEHVEGLSGTHEVELTIDGERVRTFAVRPPAAGNDHSRVDKDLNARVKLKAGPHVVGAAFVKLPSLLLETERQPYQAHFNMDRHPRITPALYTLTINGPYNAEGPGDTPSRKRVLVCGEQSDACAEKIVRALARRAYRRPAVAGDVEAPLRFYREAKAREGFEAGIEMALRAVLVSPEFLFRVEQDPAGVAAGAAYRVSDFELASRLSFFLWSSIPDEELLAAAERGELRSAAGLERQARRMLADARARSLATNFAGQWLHLRNLAAATPDMRLFAGFDDNLRQAMRRETELFFESIARENRSVLDLLGADYTYLNERLAKHYGIANVYGSRMRRVALEAGSRRGGLLRQGSVLTVTSYATRTSPVIRGKWVLENLLGIVPPPPPATVPALKEQRSMAKPATMRERLAEHRTNPACAGCHQLIDPAGFALENYDGVGRWRETDGGAALDVKGMLPDGSRFDGAAELQQTLLRRPELFATALTEKLLTYALGRGVEYYDAPAVRRIVKAAAAKEYRFTPLIVEIVASTPFQMRSAQ